MIQFLYISRIAFLVFSYTKSELTYFPSIGQIYSCNHFSRARSSANHLNATMAECVCTLTSGKLNFFIKNN